MSGTCSPPRAKFEPDPRDERGLTPPCPRSLRPEVAYAPGPLPALAGDPQDLGTPEVEPEPFWHAAFTATFVRSEAPQGSAADAQRFLEDTAPARLLFTPEETLLPLIKRSTPPETWPQEPLVLRLIVQRTAPDAAPDTESLQEGFWRSWEARGFAPTLPPPSAAGLLERGLNGCNPWRFQWVGRNPDGSDQLAVMLSWEGYAIDAESPGIPHLRIILRGEPAPAGAGERYARLSIEAIEVRRPRDTAARRLTPADGADWEAALHLARSSNLLAGEIDAHLVRGHAVSEQYQLALLSACEETSPLYRLLWPHLRSSAAIGKLGTHLIFGEHGVLARTSELSPAGVTQRMVDALGEHDWKGFEPRRPMCPEDRFAKAGRILWDAIGAHVDAFFAAEGAAVDPAEIAAFSAFLVGHAVPWGQVSGHADAVWVDAGEAALPADAPGRLLDRRTRRPKSLHPIRSGAGMLDDLKQLARTVIWLSTFWHSHCNDAQLVDGGDVRLASFRLRDLPFPSELGGADPRARWRDQALPAPEDAGYQLILAEMLTRVRWGRLMATPAEEPDNRVPPALQAFLRARQGELADLGIDLSELRSRVNI